VITATSGLHKATSQLVRPQRIAVIGQGYVGLPLSMLAVEAGYDVIGVDTDLNRVERLRRSGSYVDDIGNEELRSALRSGRYTPASDYAAVTDFDIAVITVPTPLRERSPDAVVVLTDHDDVDYELVEREARWILDCRNRLSGPNVEVL
jgi:UDP-N-acetyl-D-mannosaminuronate dehydrogenase